MFSTFFLKLLVETGWLDVYWSTNGPQNGNQISLEDLESCTGSCLEDLMLFSTKVHWQAGYLLWLGKITHLQVFPSRLCHIPLSLAFLFLLASFHRLELLALEWKEVDLCVAVKILENMKRKCSFLGSLGMALWGVFFFETFSILDGCWLKLDLNNKKIVNTSS